MNEINKRIFVVNFDILFISLLFLFKKAFDIPVDINTEKIEPKKNIIEDSFAASEYNPTLSGPFKKFNINISDWPISKKKKVPKKIGIDFFKILFFLYINFDFRNFEYTFFSKIKKIIKKVNTETKKYKIDASKIPKVNLLLLKNKKIDKNTMRNSGFKIASKICDDTKKS